MTKMSFNTSSWTSSNIKISNKICSIYFYHDHYWIVNHDYMDITKIKCDVSHREHNFINITLIVPSALDYCMVSQQCENKIYIFIISSGLDDHHCNIWIHIFDMDNQSFIEMCHHSELEFYYNHEDIMIDFDFSVHEHKCYLIHQSDHSRYNYVMDGNDIQKYDMKLYESLFSAEYISFTRGPTLYVINNVALIKTNIITGEYEIIEHDSLNITIFNCLTITPTLIYMQHVDTLVIYDISSGRWSECITHPDLKLKEKKKHKITIYYQQDYDTLMMAAKKNGIIYFRMVKDEYDYQCDDDDDDDAVVISCLDGNLKLDETILQDSSEYFKALMADNFSDISYSLDYNKIIVINWYRLLIGKNVSSNLEPSQVHELYQLSDFLQTSEVCDMIFKDYYSNLDHDIHPSLLMIPSFQDNLIQCLATIVKKNNGNVLDRCKKIIELLPSDMKCELLLMIVK